MIDHSCDTGILAHQDKDRRPGLAVLFGPFPAQFVPQPAEHRYRVMRPFEDRFRLRVGLFAAAFGGREPRQDIPPDIEIAGDLAAGRIAHRELRDLDQAGFDRIRQPEIAYHPREYRVGRDAGTANEIGCRR